MNCNFTILRGYRVGFDLKFEDLKNASNQALSYLSFNIIQLFRNQKNVKCLPLN